MKAAPSSALRRLLAGVESAVLLANGEWEDTAWIAARASRAEVVLAADGAALRCRKHDIRPHIIAGDFDSIPPDMVDVFGESALLHRDPDQETFDLEKCLNLLIDLAPPGIPIGILGAFGARLDHTLANLMLASRHPTLLITLEDARQAVHFAVPGAQEHPKNRFSAPVGTPVSLLPIGTAKAVHTRGLRYPTAGRDLVSTGLLGSSNAMSETEAEIRFESGSLAVIVSKNA